MSTDSPSPLDLEVEKIVESAQRLGIELDKEEALQWLAAIAAVEGQNAAQGDYAVDEGSGIFGHKVALLDFSPQQLSHFRQVGHLVEFYDQPGKVETALALSGSSAQSKIQTYPGDADFFERVNILAESQAEACRILAELMREKALSTEKGPTYQLIEVKFGSYPEDLSVKGQAVKAGSPIAWTPEDIRAGGFAAQRADGSSTQVTWSQAASDPGWCKLDWVIADPLRGQLANASNMLDVTWEAPNGEITPLDGYLDPYFQEVYLEAESIPIFAKLARHVSADALEHYVGQLEKEVGKYLSHAPANYGKAAKRMYNIFRLTGRYQEAAYIRELFDEPAAMLYQVWSLIRTIDDCVNPDSPIAIENVLAQTDQLIIAVIQALEGEQETEIVRRLLHLRDALSRQESNQALTQEAEAARSQVINIVNNFFYEKLTAIPQIKSYMDAFSAETDSLAPAD